jgi:hypothetical protein
MSLELLNKTNLQNALRFANQIGGSVNIGYNDGDFRVEILFDTAISAMISTVSPIDPNRKVVDHRTSEDVTQYLKTQLVAIKLAQSRLQNLSGKFKAG